MGDDRTELGIQRKLIADGFWTRRGSMEPEKRTSGRVLQKTDHQTEIDAERRSIVARASGFEPNAVKDAPSWDDVGPVEEDVRLVRCHLMKTGNGSGICGQNACGMEISCKVVWYGNSVWMPWENSKNATEIIRKFPEFFIRHPFLLIPNAVIPIFGFILETARRDGFKFAIDSIWLEGSIYRIRIDARTENHNIAHPILPRLFSDFVHQGGPSPTIELVVPDITLSERTKVEKKPEFLWKLEPPSKSGIGGINIDVPGILWNRIHMVVDRIAASGIDLDGLTGIGMIPASDRYEDMPLARSVVLKSKWKVFSGNRWIVDRFLETIDLSRICWACGGDAGQAEGICRECWRKALGNPAS